MESIIFVVDSVCLSVCMYVCLYVCMSDTLLLQIASSFLFLNDIEPFLAVSSPFYKTFSSIFDLGPQKPKIYSPKFYRPLFTGAAAGQIGRHTCVMAATGNLCTQRLACGADLCCHGNDICAKRGV